MKKGIRCKHGKTDRPFAITVLGKVIELTGSPLCIPCTQAYMDKNSTSCALCDKPILPGNAVGHTDNGTFAHLECINCSAVFCGHWGEGQLIPFSNGGEVMFEKLKQALLAGKFVALQATADGGIKFAGAYNDSRDAFSDFSADSPGGMAGIPQVIFVRQFPMPKPPENL